MCIFVNTVQCTVFTNIHKSTSVHCTLLMEQIKILCHLGNVNLHMSIYIWTMYTVHSSVHCSYIYIVCIVHWIHSTVLRFHCQAGIVHWLFSIVLCCTNNSCNGCIQSLVYYIINATYNLDSSINVYIYTHGDTYISTFINQRLLICFLYHNENTISLVNVLLFIVSTYILI